MKKVFVIIFLVVMAISVCLTANAEEGNTVPAAVKIVLPVWTKIESVFSPDGSIFPREIRVEKGVNMAVFEVTPDKNGQLPDEVSFLPPSKAYVLTAATNQNLLPVRYAYGINIEDYGAEKVNEVRVESPTPDGNVYHHSHKTNRMDRVARESFSRNVQLVSGEKATLFFLANGEKVGEFELDFSPYVTVGQVDDRGDRAASPYMKIPISLVDVITGEIVDMEITLQDLYYTDYDVSQRECAMLKELPPTVE